MTSRFAEQVIVITGAGRGIGAATAALMAREGARVAVLARTRAEVEATARAIGTEHAMPIACDVASEAEVIAAFARVTASWGRPRHLVNNAGVLGKAPLLEMDVGTWDGVMAVNLRGAFLCAREFLRDRPAELGGSIVNVSSIAGVSNVPKFPGFVAYATSKAGLHAFTEVLAVEAASFGVRVNAVAPGSTDTAMFKEAAPAGMSPVLTPDDIARVIAFACSDEARGITGSRLDAWGSSL